MGRLALNVCSVLDQIFQFLVICSNACSYYSRLNYLCDCLEEGAVLGLRMAAAPSCNYFTL